MLNKVLNEHKHKCQAQLRILQTSAYRQHWIILNIIVIKCVTTISSDTWTGFSFMRAQMSVRLREKEGTEQIKWNVLEISHKALHNSTLVPVLYEIVTIEESTSF